MKTTIRNLSFLGIAAAVWLPSTIQSAEADPAASGQMISPADIENIRNGVKPVTGTLPEKMPGSEADTPARIELGKKLYFDTILSENRTISCNSCHRVDNRLPGVDGQATSPGAFGMRGDRNSPTVLNAGFHFAQFWDGRAEDLVEQAKGPILNPVEMAMQSDVDVLKRIRASKDYRALFAKAFPGADPAISYQNIAEAIASFERTLITRDRFDDFLNGDNTALTKKELRGLQTFMEIGCTTCHNGPLLGGNMYQKVGLIHPYENTEDLGRYAVTKNEFDKFKFKVPSLRNIALTAPYFHDGKVKTLEEAVRKMAWMQLSRELSEEETSSIVEFFKSLSGKDRVPMEKAVAQDN